MSASARATAEQHVEQAEGGSRPWPEPTAPRLHLVEPFGANRSASLAAQPVATLRRWLSVRHSLVVEVLTVLALYGLYEASRGLVAGDTGVAVRHADDVVSVERWLHVFVERDVQQAAHAIPGLAGTLGVLYLTLHLTITGGYLLWLHRRRPDTFPFVRTTLLFASGLALVGYLVFPTAPPRLAGIGILDTVSNSHIDLDRGLVSSLYNPFAAVPSMHIGYAAIVGASLFLDGRRATLRLAALAYPALVLLVIVATGNHFLVDAAAGAAVAGIAALAAVAVTRTPDGK